MAHHTTMFPPGTDPVIPNTIRRLVFQDIPHYAFDPESMRISHNTTAYNNDYLRLRISLIPVKGLRNTQKLHHDFIQSGESLAEDVLTMKCSVTHDGSTHGTDQFLSLTTDQCQFTVNGMPIDSPYDPPMLICRLPYKGTLSFVARTRYDLPRKHPRFNPVANCYFTIKESSAIELVLEPRPGIMGDEIISRACAIILSRLDILEQKSRDTDLDGRIDFPDDTFTIPMLITSFLQVHPHIQYAGARCEHLLGTKTTVMYRIAKNSSEKTKSITKIIHDVKEAIKKQILSVAV